MRSRHFIIKPATKAPRNSIEGRFWCGGARTRLMSRRMNLVAQRAFTPSRAQWPLSDIAKGIAYWRRGNPVAKRFGWWK